MSYTDSIINISNFRVNTAQNRFTIGKASKLEVLNAEVDRNADLSTQVRLQEQWGITKIRLMQLMGKVSTDNFRVQDEIETDKALLFNDLISLAEQQNPQLQIQYIQQKIQEYELKQVKGSRLPVVSVNSGYNLVRSLSPFGFITESTGRNFTYGFTATLNIFDGFNQNRIVKTTSMQLENTKLQIEDQKLAIQSQIATLFQTYQTQLQLAQLEYNNERIAEQNLDITLEKFKIGTLTPVEFRTAQLNYINAVIRWQNALLEAKLSEIALKELAGNLSF
jgi:outer membrane protein TolC